MSATLVATAAGLATALCYGTSDWLSARSTKHLAPFEVNFAVQTLGMTFALVVLLLAPIHVDNAGQVVRIALSSLFTTGGYLILLQALSRGAVGIIVPLANVYPLITLLLALVFATSRFQMTQLIGMFMIILGAVLLAYEKNDKQIPFRPLHRQSALALLAA